MDFSYAAARAWLRAEQLVDFPNLGAEMECLNGHTTSVDASRGLAGGGMG